MADNKPVPVPKVSVKALVNRPRITVAGRSVPMPDDLLAAQDQYEAAGAAVRKDPSDKNRAAYREAKDYFVALRTAYNELTDGEEG